MYRFLVIFHIISFIALLFTAYRVFVERYLSNRKHLMLSAGLCIVYSLGYLFEVLSKSLPEAKVCLYMEYLGLGFMPLAFFLFICEYCNYKVKKPIKAVILLFDIFIEILVVLCDYNTLYYTSVEFVTDGMFPHLVLGHAIFYYIFILEEFTLFIWAAVLVLKKRNRETNRTKRRLLTFMFVVTLLPMLAVGFNLSDLFMEYDVGPLMSTITLSLTIMLMLNSNLTDVVRVSMTSLYYNLGNGIIVLDNDGRFLDCNYVASTIFPQLQNCPVGTNVKDIGVNLHERIEEQFFQRGDVYYSSTAGRLFNKGIHVGYIISIVDVTLMHNQIEEMAALKAQADAASDAKSKFLATMSHEIRTPLNAIIGMASLSEMENNSETIRNNNHQIKEAGEMLLDIVSEVLDISKAESGKLEIVLKEYDVRELLEGVINVSNMHMGDKTITFMVDINPGIPRKLIGDNVRIRQILMNYLSNAQKYTDNGSITLKIDYENKGDSIILKGAVSDTGRGIKEADKTRLFKLFTQVDTRRNHEIAGTGLGLSIVAKLVELMHGTYGVDSVYGEGSTFYFEIPQEVADSAPVLPAFFHKPVEVPRYSSFQLFEEEYIHEMPEAENSDSQGKEKAENLADCCFPDAKVMVVDDNEVNLKVLGAFLKQFGVVPDTCMRGREAIDKFKEDDYDLIFMDQMMPEMDGLEAARLIRAIDTPRAKNVKIIACTANVLSTAVNDFEAAGMDDFISKPIIFNQLKEIVVKYLGQNDALD